MYQMLRLFAVRWIPCGLLVKRSESDAASCLNPFNLLRWFSVLSSFIVAAISVGVAAALTHFLAREILDRDAVLTNQFVESIVASQNKEARLGRGVTLAQVLDGRADLAALGVERKEANAVRDKFYDHLALLPDVLLANVYAVDRRIIWSTNPALVGKLDTDNSELEEAIKTRTIVAKNYLNQDGQGDTQHKIEQAFVFQPKRFFVESYMPLLNGNGDVLAVVEIYKEPARLLDAVTRCHRLVWSCTALGMLFLYLAMFWIIRRADRTLEDQQRRLLESETLCVIGEMSASVAHGIRNPLASIRSSAELSLEGDFESKQKNANDIITQVDRLGQWVRDLLVFSRPVNGETEAMDLVSLVDECLPNFAAQLQRNGVAAQIVRPAGRVPLVAGNRALATQALSSVVSNAIEAMPQGGRLQIEVQVAETQRQVSVIVSDTGQGMSASQMDLVSKPFYTTKRNGLGLGMALVKRIMDRFGGAIELRSVEGKGTSVGLVFLVESRRG